MISSNSTSKKNIHPDFFLVMALTTASASTSASSFNVLEEAIPIPESFYEIKSGFESSPFDSLLPSYQNGSLSSEKDIIESFLSKIVSESKDLDGEIVNLVNKNFWDLI